MKTYSPLYEAYLILVSKADTGEPLYSNIWGPCPPWESSYQESGIIVGVYRSATGSSYDEARKTLLWNLAYTGAHPNSRFEAVTNKFEDGIKAEFDALVIKARRLIEQATQS